MKRILLKVDDETHETLKRLQKQIADKYRMSITLNNLVVTMINEHDSFRHVRLPIDINVAMENARSKSPSGNILNCRNHL